MIVIIAVVIGDAHNFGKNTMPEPGMLCSVANVLVAAAPEHLILMQGT